MFDKKVIIIGRCKDKKEHCCTMNFFGHFKGVAIRKIILTGELCCEMVVNHEYLLEASIHCIEGSSLHGTLERCVDIDDVVIDPT
jgi:hypothetical protein